MVDLDFEKYLREGDYCLANAGLPVHHRLLELAISLLKKDAELVEQGGISGIKDFTNFGKSWYRDVYGENADFPTQCGYRLLVVRHGTFLIRLPSLPFAKEDANVVSMFRGMPNKLLDILDDSEKKVLIVKLRKMLSDEDAIRMCLHSFGYNGKPENDAGTLIVMGWYDLQLAPACYHIYEPARVCWPLLQAVEKYFKALILHLDSSCDLAQLKDKFRHNLEKLFRECVRLVPELNLIQSQLQPFLKLGPNIRYARSELTSEEAVELLDLANDICAFISERLNIECRPERIKKWKVRVSGLS